MSVARRFPVKPKTTTMLVGALFFAVCAGVILWRAVSIENGETVFGVHISQGPARVVLFVLGGLSIGMVGAAVLAVMAYRGRTLELVIDDEGVSAPGPVWDLGPHAVRFADVTDIQDHDVAGQRMLTLKTARRKIFFAKSMLPAGAYEEAVALVKQQMSVRR